MFAGKAPSGEGARQLLLRLQQAEGQLSLQGGDAAASTSFTADDVAVSLSALDTAAAPGGAAPHDGHSGMNAGSWDGATLAEAALPATSPTAVNAVSVVGNNGGGGYHSDGGHPGSDGTPYPGGLSVVTSRSPQLRQPGSNHVIEGGQPGGGSNQGGSAMWRSGSLGGEWRQPNSGGQSPTAALLQGFRDGGELCMHVS